MLGRALLCYLCCQYLLILQSKCQYFDMHTLTLLVHMILCCCSEMAPAFPTGSRELACAMVSVPACSKQPWQCCCGSRILVLQALNRKARAVLCAGSLTLAGPAGNGVCPAGIPLWALKALWEAKDPWTLTRVVLCSVSEPKMFCEHPWLVFGTLFLIFPPLLCALAVRTR